MSLVISPAHKKAFEEIFNLVANKEGKIDRKGLEDIFKFIDYKLTEKQLTEVTGKLFAKKKIPLDLMIF